MDKIKYLHVMTHPAMFFNGNIIDTINLNNNYFNPEEHLFLVGYEDIFQKYKKYNNVVFVPKIMTKNYSKFISFSKKAQYVFLHQNWFYDFVRLIFTPIKIRKKYVWCVWGHDLYTNFLSAKGTKEKIKLILRKIGDMLINYEVKYYKGIGIGFKYDALQVKSRFKNKSRILMCPYPVGLKLQEIDAAVEEVNDGIKNKNKPIKIMVAHSAHQYLHHKEMLDKLAAYKNENIIISLPLVYGNMDYAKKIEEHARNIFADKVEILKKRMEPKDYIQYLTTVDIAIFDQIHQSGLGNLYYLIYLGKKLYLNKNGFFKLAFQLEGSYIDTTDKIGCETYENFIKENQSMERARAYAMYILNEKNQLEMWKSTFDILK